MLTVEGIDHVGLAVKDVRKSVEWYREMFGLDRLYEDVWGDFPGVVGVGNTSIAFFPADDPDVPLPPPQVCPSIIWPSAWTARISRRRRMPFE
jgi:catechol 2,3-dioxygenase-like lactoylglutathione lyase family enzyme